MKKYGIIIQARSSSKRFPNKILQLVNGIPMIVRQFLRIRNKLDYPVIVATSSHRTDQKLIKVLIKYNIPYFRGDLKNVIKRFVDCGKKFKFKNIIRVGGDDPFIDPEGIEKLINFQNKKNLDLLYTSHKNGWPYGCAAELFSTKVLKKINKKNLSKFDREHIIPYFFNNRKKFYIKKIYSPKSIRNIRMFLSVDYKKDFYIVKKIFEYFDKKAINPSMTQLNRFYKKNKKLFALNKNLHNGF
jgi:spore coat polysaccharide biosynthesis protein SpsF